MIFDFLQPVQIVVGVVRHPANIVGAFLSIADFVIFETHRSASTGLRQNPSYRVVAESVNLIEGVLDLNGLETLIVFGLRRFTFGIGDGDGAVYQVVSIIRIAVGRVGDLFGPAQLVVFEFLFEPRAPVDAAGCSISITD